jgi:fructokinase
VTVVGEALIDLVPTDGADGYRAKLGGSPYNVGIGLARLGHPVHLKARLSRDGFGQRLRGHAEREGVLLDHAPHADEPTTLAVVTLDAEGRARYQFYAEGTADWQWTRAELAPVPPGTAIVHFGSLASWRPPSEQTIRDWVGETRAAGVLTSYDPNVRPGLQADRARAVASVEASVAVSDVVKASSDDLVWLYPDVSPAAVARAWIERGAHLVVVTDGADGARLWTAGEELARPAPAIELVDTVGAGDAFTAGLLGGLLLRGLTTGSDLDRAGAGVLTELLDEAVLTAALTCEREGAHPPTRAEVDRRRPG